MSNDVSELQEQAQTRKHIVDLITQQFAQEDEGLRSTLVAGQEAGLPSIQISPTQGKLLQLLALACGARKILEIGSLAGYSGIWLARALPAGGKLITLEISAKHAEVVRGSFERAGVSDRAEVRVGNALEALPQLVSEGPFDLIFIDADKAGYPQYLDWAIRLSRVGSIIVADNCVRGGKALQEPEPAENQDENRVGLVKYNQQAASDERLASLALPNDEDYLDGFTISVVREK